MNIYAGSGLDTVITTQHSTVVQWPITQLRHIIMFFIYTYEFTSNYIIYLYSF